MTYNTSGMKERNNPQGATPTEWSENERILATGSEPSTPLVPIFEYYTSATESPNDRILNLVDFPVIVGALVPVVNSYVDTVTETVLWSEGLLVLGTEGQNGQAPSWVTQYILTGLSM